MDEPFERLMLPARLDSLRPLIEFARQGGEKAGLGSSELDQLALVLEEILVNIALYAYQPEEGDMELAYRSEGYSKLWVEVSDQGRCFNPLDAPEPELKDELIDQKVGGWGIFLVKFLAESISYRRENGRNIISFRFPRSETAGTSNP